MALYDYCCEQGHVTEQRQGMSVSSIPCPLCGRIARRVPIYENQYIIGETVAKGRYNKATRAGNIKDKHGRTRLSLFQEASAEVGYAHGKREQEAGRRLPEPPLYKEALKRAGVQKGVPRARDTG